MELKKIIVDVNWLADFFAVTTRAINKWVAEEGAPRDQKGQYPLLKFLKWRIDFLGERIAIYKQNIDETTNKQKLEYEKIKTKRMNLEYKKELNKVVDKRQTLNAWSNQINVVNSNIIALENELVRDLDLTEEQRNKLKERFNDTRDSIGKLEIEKFILDDEKLLEDDNSV